MGTFASISEQPGNSAGDEFRSGFRFTAGAADNEVVLGANAVNRVVGLDGSAGEDYTYDSATGVLAFTGLTDGNVYGVDVYHD